MSFPARFAGECASIACTRPIEVGDAVTYLDPESLVHDECTLSAGLPEPITRDVCPECFIERDLGGGCLC